MTYESIIAGIKNQEEIQNALQGFHPHIAEVFHDCCTQIFDVKKPCDASYKFKIDYISTFLHSHLNLGDWCDVPPFQRQAFTAVCFVRAMIILKLSNCLGEVREAIKTLDRGFLLGLPLKKVADLVTSSARVLTDGLESYGSHLDVEIVAPRKRAKVESVDVKGKDVPCLPSPSLEEFYKNYFIKQTPIIIKGCISHWPACVKWKDINYLLKVAGDRLVPVELGSSYSAENFSQKLMTIRQFVHEYYLRNDKGPAYLAQHDLLNQIPELKEDIRMPEYCCCGRAENEDASDPEINVWFGPEGTVSSLHQDPQDNLLCQVYGSKQIILFSPSDSKYLYVHETPLLNNTAKVDPTKPDLEKYPEFGKATMYKCVLDATEMLYIPPKWWHHVVSLEKSFSVNFWWQ